MKATTDEKVKRRGRSTPCLAAPLATAREMTRHQCSYTAAIFPELFLRAPRAWEDPSTLPSIAKEAPLEPIEVEHNPSTGNSEEDRPGEDEISLKKRGEET